MSNIFRPTECHALVDGLTCGVFSPPDDSNVDHSCPRWTKNGIGAKDTDYVKSVTVALIVYSQKLGDTKYL